MSLGRGFDSPAPTAAEGLGVILTGDEKRRLAGPAVALATVGIIVPDWWYAWVPCVRAVRVRSADQVPTLDLQ
jgi:hypothetical protein